MQGTPADDGDDFGSVAWDNPRHDSTTEREDTYINSAGTNQFQQQQQASSSSPASHQNRPTSNSNPISLTTAVHSVQVKDGKVELEGTSDTFVSYLVTAKVIDPRIALVSVSEMTM